MSNPTFEKTNLVSFPSKGGEWFQRGAEWKGGDRLLILWKIYLLMRIFALFVAMENNQI